MDGWMDGGGKEGGMERWEGLMKGWLVGGRGRSTFGPQCVGRIC